MFWERDPVSLGLTGGGVPLLVPPDPHRAGSYSESAVTLPLPQLHTTGSSPSSNVYAERLDLSPPSFSWKIPLTFCHAHGIAGKSYSLSSAYFSGVRTGWRGLWGRQTPYSASTVGARQRFHCRNKNMIPSPISTGIAPPCPTHFFHHHYPVADDGDHNQIEYLWVQGFSLCHSALPFEW